MLPRELVVSADNASAKEAPNTLDRVRVNVPANPLVLCVGNASVLRIPIAHIGIGGAVVPIDRGRVIGNRVDDEVDQVFLRRPPAFPCFLRPCKPARSEISA
jgi:hypothetical protein